MNIGFLSNPLRSSHSLSPIKGQRFHSFFFENIGLDFCKSCLCRVVFSNIKANLQKILKSNLLANTFSTASQNWGFDDGLNKNFVLNYREAFKTNFRIVAIVVPGNSSIIGSDMPSFGLFFYDLVYLWK